MYNRGFAPTRPVKSSINPSKNIGVAATRSGRKVVAHRFPDENICIENTVKTARPPPLNASVRWIFWGPRLLSTPNENLRKLQEAKPRFNRSEITKK
tara:strand:- start:206 stop:496 length:291 start_codon:yes stop_codon:yes gene_type:complete